jgi:DnaJ-related protein SCJ1
VPRQVLSDDEKRSVYDLDGEEGLERHEKGGNAPASPFDMLFGMQGACRGGRQTVSRPRFRRRSTWRPMRSHVLCPRNLPTQYLRYPGGRRKGPDAHVEMEVTLEDLYNGATRAARISRNVICPKCRGTGAKDGETQKCRACNGRGVRMVQQQMAPGFVVQMQETCSECGGRGNIAKAACPHCNGRKVRGAR